MPRCGAHKQRPSQRPRSLYIRVVLSTFALVTACNSLPFFIFYAIDMHHQAPFINIQDSFKPIQLLFLPFLPFSLSSFSHRALSLVQLPFLDRQPVRQIRYSTSPRRGSNERREWVGAGEKEGLGRGMDGGRGEVDS